MADSEARRSTNPSDEGTDGGPVASVDERDPDRSETVTRQLSASLQELQEVVKADPLNAELQQARYDVYDALDFSQGSDTGHGTRTGVYHLKMAAVSTSSGRKRGLDDGSGDAGRARDAIDRRINAMNAKNLYSRREYAPDFAELAKRYPVLCQHLEAKAKTPAYNFKSWEACRDLVNVQFEHDFGVRSWTVPPPHLIPPLANRLNYLCYIHDLLELDGRVSARVHDDLEQSERVRILDVGCGANLVYPLLAAAYFRWCSIGCDVNEAALLHAAKLRDSNPDIAPLIILKHVGGLDALKEERVDAMVCNPPFFDSSVGEAAGQNPRTDYGGTHAEMWCEGGEERFVINLIRQSKAFGDRCGWFSSMCGKKKTLRDAKLELAKLNEEALDGADQADPCEKTDTVRPSGVTYRVCTLEQGTTTRWVLAWRWNVL